MDLKDRTVSDATLELILAAIAETRDEAREFRTEIRDRLAALEAELIQTRTEVMGRIDRLQDRVAALEADLAQARTEIMNRIDRLQDRLITQRDDDVVQFNAIERAERLMKTTREDVGGLSEQINALIRQVRTLSGRIDHLEDRSGAA
ncbi:MAG: hypothetical protein EXR07_02685 [Acetobacteraceae bacterium]|nr:hypothetical protein [Acetobacteraceae bacterium]